jgi:uncharacterized protein DUF6983
MTIQIIPTYADPSWVQSTTLEGTTFLLNFDYNERCQCYYLSIQDSEGNDIYDGMKMVCNLPLLRTCADKDNAPQGELWVGSNNGDLDPPDVGELGPGARCTLYYITSDLLP